MNLWTWIWECFRHHWFVLFIYSYGSKYSFSHFSTLNQTQTLTNYVRIRCPGFKHILRYQHAKGSTGISGHQKKAVLVDRTIFLHYNGQIWSHSNQISHHLLLKFCTTNCSAVHKENLWCYGFKDVFSTNHKNCLLTIMQRQTSTGYRISIDKLKENRQDWVWLPFRIVYASDLRNSRGAPNSQIPAGYFALIHQGQNIWWHETSRAQVYIHQLLKNIFVSMIFATACVTYWLYQEIGFSPHSRSESE